MSERKRNQERHCAAFGRNQQKEQKGAEEAERAWRTEVENPPAETVFTTRRTAGAYSLFPLRASVERTRETADGADERGYARAGEIRLRVACDPRPSALSVVVFQRLTRTREFCVYVSRRE